ncbi:nicotinamidase/pyrazinamidase [uncultured Clostridium sp.]|uniref:nicotinamidase n=1 Tax=Muricoprocola aceti TaxID=2981772 RepID=A0ABT2SP74_9FIRM|nr:isochorismatase family cysteine hydrolase [Muricoprocola aceti]MCI7226524.1 cysteine hydrolase [Lachnospiraceae bacterium]SCH84069.1 nicotinamidase/pyrazinamidase [uncultured Clostridium sp.]MCU6726271.1 cysteine hydrolase [Muricoprocola aceti]MDD7434794.1 cysteine hydrolase [Lachnospiraceae bacterium]MDY3341826.1 isochorismatase family cysteine hydrolase [Lachnospiraceae bacterium]
MNILVVIDMQNDFIDGALGTPEAVAIVPKVMVKMMNFDGLVLATRDTHGEDYLERQEGKKLPVVHCIKGTHGWEIKDEIQQLLISQPIDKPTFGSEALGKVLKDLNNDVEPIDSITLVGLCTDICVISNAMLLKAFLPEVPIMVDASCCAGVTPESHERALEAMKACQIEII